MTYFQNKAIIAANEQLGGLLLAAREAAIVIGRGTNPTEQEVRDALKTLTYEIAARASLASTVMTSQSKGEFVGRASVARAVAFVRSELSEALPRYDETAREIMEVIGED